MYALYKYHGKSNERLVAGVVIICRSSPNQSPSVDNIIKHAGRDYYDWMQ